MSNLPSIIAHDREPVTASNLPFQPRIAYRADDYSSLRAKLLQHLQEQFPRWNGRLSENQGRQDLAVVFVEAFAYLCDILGFYQDCRANEAFLRTARLADSLTELCALIDYRPAPGAAASTLQAFTLKDGQTGTIPAGFKVKTKPSNGTPALVFETAAALAADAARNALRPVGHDRSARLLNQPGLPEDTSVLLDAGYAGLKAGGMVLFEVTGSTPAVHPVQLTAVTVEHEKVRIAWKPGGLPAGAGLPIADLTILGKPKQVMAVAEKARADEITAGRHEAAVETPSVLTVNDRVAFVGEGFTQPAKIIAKSGAVVTWDRGFPTSLRRSTTRVYTAGHDGFAVAWGPIRAGRRSIVADPAYGVKAAAGEYLLVSDSGAVEMVLVTSVSGNTYYLADPLPRSFPSGATLFRLALPSAETGAGGSPSTAIALPKLTGAETQLILDRAYEGLEPGAALVLSDGVALKANRVAGVVVDEARRTVLTLDDPIGAAFSLATLAIHGPFELAMRVDGYNRAEGSTLAGATSLTLKGLVPGLKPGDYLIAEGGGRAEGVRASAVSVQGGDTLVDLQAPLVQAYPLADLVVSGNVVEVGHGESAVERTLGSGDQSQANQRFALHRAPTTYLHDAEGPRGLASTLEILVDGERWAEVDSLAESGPEDRHYVVERREGEPMAVLFGDGRHGAKLPTGRNNVQARYRVGLGVRGNVAAGAITVVPQPLPFLASTRNPLAAAGGADRETVEETRRLAPVTVKTLDRAVSLADYADLALAYPGIAKARTDWDWEGLQRVVVLTVASVGGLPLTPTLKQALAAYLDARRPPHHRLKLRDHVPFPVRLSLDVHVLPGFLRMETKVRVERALGSELTEEGGRGYFHFDRRDLGGELFLSDVYALVEGVRGVDYVVARAFQPDTAAAAPAVLDRLAVPLDGLATGGHATDPAVGRLTVSATGGLA